MNYIITPEVFAKSCKRLSKLTPNTTLSLTHENLAKSLGFRSYQGLQDYFAKPEEKLDKPPAISVNMSANNTSASFFDFMNEEEIISLVTSCIRSDSDLWTQRALLLANALIPVLVYMREEKEILFDSGAINDFLILDNIIKLYKTRRDFPSHLRSKLYTYLVSLPGFQPASPTQTSTVFDQHGYLQMQYTWALSSLLKIEKESIVILPQEVVASISLEKHFSYEYWLKKDSPMNHWDNWENSTFLSEEIIQLVRDCKTQLKGRELTLRDLITMPLNYMDQKKRASVFRLAISYANNLNLTKRYSQELKELMLVKKTS